ncbi:MAG: hypothetical protein VYE64_12135, partial [Planctomycetota bacterium]|nr:hypothetical protein [Planctomycetota bacterium]
MRHLCLVKSTSLLLCACLTLLVGLTGCKLDDMGDARKFADVILLTSNPQVEVKPAKKFDYRGPLRRLWAKRQRPSERTLLFLRRNNLEEQYESSPSETVAYVQENCRLSPTMAQVHAIAELSEIEANWLSQVGQQKEAVQLYLTSIIHAYQFLFAPQLNLKRNAYDPQFRQICDTYNRSLEGMLKIMCPDSRFQPEHVYEILAAGDFRVEFEMQIEGRWKAEEFERFELVSDFEMDGLENSYKTFGLGVPLIAVRKATDSATGFEQYYPPSLAMPMTAFCEVDGPENGGDAYRVKMRLFDPLETSMVSVEGRNIPLESEYTLPLAYYLSDPLLNSSVLSAATLLSADIADELYGMYMIEPYDPEKIPVVMVHGFWSSPVTWLPMFNDLRANPEIRKQYQFWFYMYPTGQPFWISARQLRDDLLELRHTVDPLNQSESMEQMVLVGHSMGGLLSRMQTIDSGDQFWNIFSEEPFEKMKGDLAKLSDLKNLFYFEDNQSVARVITIASPHHGTHYSNSLTRWVGQKLFSLPQMLESQFSDFVDLNRENLRNIKTLTIPTSVDSLAPDSLFIQKMAEMGRANRVMFHNIYGDNSENSWLRFFNADWIRPGDGVVAVESAKVQNVQSEVGVTEEHAEVHRHPKAIVEVRRILLDHLEALGRLEKKPTFDSLVVPAGFVPDVNGVLPGEMPRENR